MKEGFWYQSKGFTLIELMASIAVMAVVLIAGTTILYRSLSSGGETEVNSNIVRMARQTTSLIERSIKFSSIDRVGISYNRFDCVSGGSLGVSDDSIGFLSSGGSEIEYSLVGGRVASGGAEFLSPPDLIISNLLFRWICNQDTNDVVRVSFDATLKSSQENESFTKSFEESITILNGGL